MRHYTTKDEKVIICSCGNKLPARWAFEGKMGLRVKNNAGVKQVEKYCVDCATDEEYRTLLTEFGHFVNSNNH